MATEVGTLVLTYGAGGNLSALQFCLVKLSGNKTVVSLAAATDIPIGVLQNKPDAAGKEAVVMVVGRTKIVGGATLSAGALISPGATGKALAAVAASYTVGQLEEGTAIDNINNAVINCINPALKA